MPFSNLLRASSINSASSMFLMPSNTCLKHSGLWVYAIDVDRYGNLPKNMKGKLVWRYVKCAKVNKSQKWKHKKGNTHFKKHFWKIHGIELIAVKGTKTIDISQLQIDIARWSKKICANIKHFRASSIGPNHGAIRAAFFNWIATDGLFFRLIKSLFFFYLFIDLFSFNINVLLSRSDDIICKNFIYVVYLRRLDIKRALFKVRLRIYLVINF